MLPCSPFVKKSFAAEQLALRQKNKVSPGVWVLVGVVVVALVVGGYVMYLRMVQEQVENEQIKSVVILGFDNMTQEKNMKHVVFRDNIFNLKVIKHGFSLFSFLRGSYSIHL